MKAKIIIFLSAVVLLIMLSGCYSADNRVGCLDGTPDEYQYYCTYEADCLESDNIVRADLSCGSGAVCCAQKIS